MQLIGRILCYCLNALPKFVCWKHHPQCNCGKEARPDRKWLGPQEQSNVLMRRVSRFRTGLWCTGACCFLTLLLLHLPLHSFCSGMIHHTGAHESLASQFRVPQPESSETLWTGYTPIDKKNSSPKVCHSSEEWKPSPREWMPCIWHPKESERTS